MRLSIWDEIKSDGKEFENIIEKLLKAMFPLRTYTKTQDTRDGGVDFYCISKNNEKLWAECKNYSTNIATSTIAKTLVMAVAEDVKEVIIFSVSELTKIAMEEISRFAMKINFNIRYIDGSLLDKYIIKYQEQLELTIDQKQKIISNQNGDLDVIYNIRKKDFLNEKYKSKFYIGDVIEYDLYFKHNELTDKIVTINFNFDKLDPVLRLLTSLPKEETFIIKSTEIFHKKILLRVIGYRETTFIPSINYTYDNKSGMIKTQRIDCDWIAEVSLLGQSRVILQDLKNGKIGRKETNFICIEGHSGVGKSRLLNEIKMAYEDLSLKCIHHSFRIEKANSKLFFKKLFSLIKNLPYINFEYDSVKSENLIHKLLYEAGFDLEKNINSVIETFKKTIRDIDYKVCLIIDDIQFADTNIKKFFEELSYYNIINLDIFCGINLDYIYDGTLSDKIHKIIEIGCKNFDGEIIKLKEFNEDCSVQYITNCLDRKILEEKRFYSTIREFAAKCGNNPLNLHQTILLLAQEKIIAKINNNFIIEDIIKFQKFISNATPDFKRTLSRRHQKYKEYFNNHDYFVFVKLLAYLKFMDEDTYYNLFQNEKMLQVLISTGLIKKDENNQIVFYHQKILNFFKEEHIEDSLTIDKLTSIVNKLSHFFDKIKFAIFHECHCINQVHMDTAIIQLERYNYYTDQDFIFALYEESIHSDLVIPSLNKLDIFQKYFEKGTAVYGRTFCLNDHIDIVESILKTKNIYDSYPSKIWRIVLTCVNTLIQLHSNEKAKDILNLFSNVYENFHYAGDKEKNGILSSLYDRYGVIYNTYEEKSRAKNYLHKAVYFAQKAKDNYKLIEAYSDLGSMYYNEHNGKRLSVKYWNKLYRIGRNKSITDPYLIVKTTYHKAVVELIKKKYKKVSSIIEDYKMKHWLNCSEHYKIKIIFIDIITSLKANKLEDIERKLNTCEDLCVMLVTQREYYKVFYLRGIFFKYYLKHYEDAFINYFNALNQMVLFCNDSMDMLFHYSLYMQDLIKNIMELKIYINDEMMLEKMNNLLDNLAAKDYLNLITDKARKKTNLLKINNINLPKI